MVRSGVLNMVTRIRSQFATLINFNSSRYRLHQLVADFASQAPPNSKVLDAGAGHAPYRDLFHHTEYQLADFTKVDKLYEMPTYVCNLEAIPVIAEWYDYIIFTQVIEHLPDPVSVLEQLRRILKPGGKILITGPLFYEEHEQPYDFYRYTQYGFRHLIEKTGMSIERIEWLEGYYGTVGYEFNRMARYLPWRPQDFKRKPDSYFFPLPMLTLKLFSLCASIVFHRLELRNKYVAAGHPKNYAIIATKSG